MGRNKIRHYHEKKLFKLFRKYRDGKINSKERDFVEAYDKWFDNKAGFYEHMPVEEQQTLTAEMLERAHEQMNYKLAIPIDHYTIRKLSAVAAVLLLFAGIWIWKQYGTGKKSVLLTQAERFKNDVAPGYNGAILTLSDGRKIMLDSTDNTTSIYDDKARIVKQRGSISYNGQAGAGQYNRITTPAGRQWRLVLPDGTKVWLNAMSSIRYPLVFNGMRREVEISGEVYLEVKHNRNQPFLVKAGGQLIEDIGTAFDVSAYNDETDVKTTLVEGSVRIAVMGTGESLLLHPGQQASSDGQGRAGVTDNVDLENVLAWKNGITAFKDADIHAIMRQVARWYNIKVVYDGKISNRLFTGEVMRNANLSDLLKILEESNIRFKINGNTITVLQ